MRINVELGVDHEDILLFDAFLQAVETRRAARQEANRAAIFAEHPMRTVALETPMSNRVVAAMAPELGMGYAKPVIEVTRDVSPGAQPVEQQSAFTEEEVAQATLALGQKNIAAVHAIFAQFGVERARDIKPEQRATYLSAVAQASN